MEPKFIAQAKPTMAGMRALVHAAYGRRLRSRVIASALVAALAAGFLFWSGVKPFSLVILALACAFLWFFARAEGRMAQKLLAASPNQALVTEFRFMDDALYTIPNSPPSFACGKRKRFSPFILPTARRSPFPRAALPGATLPALAGL